MRLRFSLRWYFTIVLLAAIAFAWLSSTPRKTGRQLDLLIIGPGYLQIQDEHTGEILYARNGHLSNRDGRLFLQGSSAVCGPVEPNICLPPWATEIVVSRTGHVVAKGPGTQASVGQLQLSEFARPNALREVSPGIFQSSPPCGPERTVATGENIVYQGWLESDRSQVPAFSAVLLMASAPLLRLRSWFAHEPSDRRHSNSPGNRCGFRTN
jgi:flagellar basal body rod protein FlgG